MKKLFILLLIILNSLNSKAQCLNADMIICVDWSGSESGNEKLLTNAVQLFLSELPISEQELRIGILAFTSDPISVSDLTADKIELNSGLTLLSLLPPQGGTNINDALEYSYQELDNERKVPKIIIIISDGEIWDIVKSTETMKDIKSYLPLSVHAVQIGGDQKGLMNLILLTGNSNLVEFATPYNLVEALKRMNLCN